MDLKQTLSLTAYQIKSHEGILHAFVAVSFAALLIGCADNSDSSASNSDALTKQEIDNYLNTLCTSRFEDALSTSKFTNEQVEQACDCFQDAFSELDEDELQNLVEYEIAVQEGSTADVPRDKRPTLQATAAMQDANSCLTPSAMGMN
jgi:hypothetical protein